MSFKNNVYSFKSSKRQNGASFLTIIFLLIIIGMVLLSGIKVAPAYMDNNVVNNAMEGIISNNDFESMGIGDIRADLQRALITNGIREFDGSNVVLTREGDNRYIDINYEYRTPLFYNIEVVVIFENRFDKN